MKLTLQTLWEEGAESLRRSGIGEAELDAKYLLFEAFQTDMVHFLMHRNEEVKDEDSVKRTVADYRRMIEKRSERIPLQQIPGSREFMGLEFSVNEYVLIPRQDTETLVEQVLKDFQGKNPEVLDLCTGSGCIGISLSILGGWQEVTLADISLKALLVAKKNAEDLMTAKLHPIRLSSEGQKESPWRWRLTSELPGMEDKTAGVQNITLVESDLFSSLSGDGKRKFDVIVSNPPYIPTNVIEELEPEVRDHEPRLALDGMEDGLYFYRRLAAECGSYLKPGGTVYFEIGYDQGQAVSGLLREAGFQNVLVYQDAPGLDRVVKGTAAS